MAAANVRSADDPDDLPDFSAPWKSSDVVLVVEDQRFHVHQNILLLWSPVFEKMFGSEFQEKNKNEILLPEKKANEIKEMLQIMYPSLEEKLVTKDNCFYLLRLAHEYQINSILKKCEACMVSLVKENKEDDLLEMLIYGQKYQLKTLISACIHEARRLPLKELKEHGMRDQIEPDNYVQIAEGIIKQHEERCKKVKDSSLKEVFVLSRSLYCHAKYKLKGSIYTLYREKETTDIFLNRLEKDTTKEIECNSLADAAEHLKKLKTAIETLP